MYLYGEHYNLPVTPEIEKAILDADTFAERDQLAEFILRDNGCEPRANTHFNISWGDFFHTKIRKLTITSYNYDNNLKARA